MKRWLRGLTFALILGAILASFGFPSLTGAETSRDKINAHALLDQIMDLASETRTLNSGPFGVGSRLDDVKAAWGAPEDDSGVAANFWSRHIRFIYDHDFPGDPITWVEDFDPDLQQISLKQLRKELGKPLKKVEDEGQLYVTYLANEHHEITFVLNASIHNGKSVVYLYYIKSIPYH
ncbi:DUF4309 domain-containing protein [Laceyella putida]|uniref:DUF4309 domain-containing protein n=1 Tax=Laceyella putida TaxID=110101 RepID=A0ABW2RQE9_9BACL